MQKSSADPWPRSLHMPLPWPFGDKQGCSCRGGAEPEGVGSGQGRAEVEQDRGGAGRLFLNLRSKLFWIYEASGSTRSTKRLEASWTPDYL